MAEFINVMEEYNRMCDHYKLDCRECPLCNVNCEYVLHNEAKKSETIIMKWAREHPPIYPTVGEVVSKLLILMNIEPRTANLTAVYDERLTKEAADYFGIKPINE